MNPMLNTQIPPKCWACPNLATALATVAGEVKPACEWHIGTWRSLGSPSENPAVAR